MKKTILPTLTAILIGCSAQTQTVEPHEAQEEAFVETTDPQETVEVIPLLEMEPDVTQYYEAATRSDISFIYSRGGTDRFVTLSLTNPYLPLMGHGWFSYNGQRLTFETAADLRQGDLVTFEGGFGMDRHFQAQGFKVGEEYEVHRAQVYVIHPTDGDLEACIADGKEDCWPTEATSRFGPEFYHLPAGYD